MTTLETPAICLKTTPYHEADRILWLYSPSQGLLRAMARGVKKSASKLSGACEMLTVNHLVLAQGKSMYTLTQYSRLNSFNRLRADLERMAFANVCTELVLRLGREADPDADAIFNAIVTAFTVLEDSATPAAVAFIVFNRTLLDIAGYSIDWVHCGSCQAALVLAAQPTVVFSLEWGGLMCDACRVAHWDAKAVPISSGTVALLQAPEILGEPRYRQKALRFLRFYWQARLEAPLRSYDFIEQLDRLTPNEGSVAETLA